MNMRRVGAIWILSHVFMFRKDVYPIRHVKNTLVGDFSVKLIGTYKKHSNLVNVQECKEIIVFSN